MYLVQFIDSSNIYWELLCASTVLSDRERTVYKTTRPQKATILAEGDRHVLLNMTGGGSSVRKRKEEGKSGKAAREEEDQLFIAGNGQGLAERQTCVATWEIT